MAREILVENLAYAREGRQIIHPLSLSLTEHRIGIIGRNGSGKSTFARLIAGLIAPDQGRVLIGDADMLKDRQAALRAIGVLFQNPDHQIIFPTVIEEIGFGLRQMGYNKAQIVPLADAILARFGREHWKDRTVHNMSEGQRHLVCLMAVLAMAPDVILLDEPYAGLDMPTQLHLARILEALPETVIQISHQISSLEGYDRVIWFEAGEVVADGAPIEVLKGYREKMTELGQGDALADL